MIFPFVLGNKINHFLLIILSDTELLEKKIDFFRQLTSYLEKNKEFIVNELNIRSIPKREISKALESSKYIWDNFYSDDFNENTHKSNKVSILHDISSWFSIKFLFQNLFKYLMKKETKYFSWNYFRNSENGIFKYFIYLKIHYFSITV